MKARTKKPVKHRERVICGGCNGIGCVWSDRTLLKWEHETPWFDREKMSPKPPESWRDLNCIPCGGAGYLDAKDGGPLMERLIDSAQRNARRRRMETGATGGRDADGQDAPGTA